jgi:hypothetical protein
VKACYWSLPHSLNCHYWTLSGGYIADEQNFEYPNNFKGLRLGKILWNVIIYGLNALKKGFLVIFIICLAGG